MKLYQLLSRSFKLVMEFLNCTQFFSLMEVYHFVVQELLLEHFELSIAKIFNQLCTLKHINVYLKHIKAYKTLYSDVTNVFSIQYHNILNGKWHILI